jgi:REP element-mobilizing transposase RayT
MPQSLAKVIVHVVYSTKHREPWLNNPKLRGELYAYNSSVLSNADCPVMLINGVEDHVHILCLLSRKLSIMDTIKKSKTETSKWLKKKEEDLQSFQWQAGYGIFSVSESKVSQVRRYIANQEEHHKRFSFQDEFRELCQRHGIDIDERYVWD